MRFASLSLWLVVLACMACAHQTPRVPAPASAERPILASTDAGLGTLEIAQAAHAPVIESSAQDRASARPAPPAPIASVAPAAEPAGSAARPPSRSEADLRERVQRALLHDHALSYTAKRVRVSVARQDVTLLGEVRTAREKGEVEELIQRVAGVRRVKNELAVIDQPANAAATQAPATSTPR